MSTVFNFCKGNGAVAIWTVVDEGKYKGRIERAEMVVRLVYADSELQDEIVELVRQRLVAQGRIPE